MGTHVDRHRHRLRQPAALTAGALVVGGLVTGGGVLGLRNGPEPAASVEVRPGDTSGSACRTSLRVAAAPAVAPALASVARHLRARDGSCVAVTVDAVTPLDVVAGLRGARTGSPDVWVPDSALWLDRTEADGLTTVDDAPSVAASPLVLGMTRQVARRLSGGRDRPTVRDLLAAAVPGPPVTLALPGAPGSYSGVAAVGAVVALSRASVPRPAASAALTSILRAARVTTDSPAESVAALGGKEAVVVPVPEQTLWAARRSDLVGAYAGTVSFDYPYAVLTGDPASADSAARLLDQLHAQRGRRALQAAGFRDVSGAPGPALTSSAYVDAGAALDPKRLDATSVARAESTLEAVTMDASLLAVLDVSGSMAWGLSGPGAAGPSRLRLALGAALRGMSYYPDTTRVGVSLFPGTEPGQQLRPVVPIAPLGPVREELSTALAEVRHVPGGDTPLYAATLAAVRQVRRGWDPDRVNAVVLLSDGHDTGGGPTLTELVDTLATMRGSARPVPVISVGLGPDSDRAALAAMSTASGGSAYTAEDATELRQVFLDALGRRVCRPDCPSVG